MKAKFFIISLIVILCSCNNKNTTKKNNLLAVPEMETCSSTEYYEFISNNSEYRQGYLAQENLNKLKKFKSTSTNESGVIIKTIEYDYYATSGDFEDFKYAKKDDAYYVTDKKSGVITIYDDTFFDKYLHPYFSKKIYSSFYYSNYHFNSVWEYCHRSDLAPDYYFDFFINKDLGICKIKNKTHIYEEYKVYENYGYWAQYTDISEFEIIYYKGVIFSEKTKYEIKEKGKIYNTYKDIQNYFYL